MDYEEKLRLAKEALESGSYDRETIEYIFPELRESEDEKIRKELIEYFKHYSGGDNVSIKFPEWIAWLEKQGEQKPAWSEEDEEALYLVSTAVEVKYSGSLFLDKKKVSEQVEKGRKLLDWLKSLKDRMKGE